MDLQIINASLEYKGALLELYKIVAKISDGIILNEDEIDEDFVNDFLEKSIDNGLILVGMIDGKIVGEIHAYTPNIYAFQHILTDLTIVVSPDNQGQGIGRKLFESFLNTVENNFSHIKRIELYTREYNTKNVKFYESLGFINEGRQKDKIFIKNATFETPIHMAWFNPGYEFDKS